MPLAYSLKGLAYLEILAPGTGKVARPAANGQGFRSGEKMEKRFLFYGVGAYRGNISVHESIQMSTDILARCAEASFPLGYDAMSFAKVTLRSLSERFIH